MSNAKSDGENQKFIMGDEPLRFQNYVAGQDEQQVPQQDQNLEYYNEYLRSIHSQCRLNKLSTLQNLYQLKELLNEKNELVTKLNKLERRNQELNSNVEETGEERKKRLRRPAQEIERHFTCPVDNCQKKYGAEGSLNQHIKLKHPELVKDRAFYKSNEQSQQQGEPESLSDLKQEQIQ
ncbi:unnamed protein product (macronuclear) [Paramecium tetraurelia]|uniref:C2H2-type domain-containing protein n=1 Tax=Paramecium tetraurelia TaxID=5888 RepID=A0CPC7_PARTE|nr:uncharacterized protein GSPATT00009035001 [Paramecium tetraurelia]CAK72644.1 unnamed protein product [Paramecium tetraurelia]|eukprot:XP_001440041.1 hypothetical protein (macronuclear) [Paramecium tetraurelia strain d4-2]